MIHSKIKSTTSCVGTKPFSAWLHPFWTEFRFSMATRVPHELTRVTTCSHFFLYLSYVLPSPGMLNFCQILGFIRPLLESRLLAVQFFLPQTCFTSSYLDAFRSQGECNFCWEALQSPPHHGLRRSPPFSEYSGLIPITAQIIQFWNYRFTAPPWISVFKAGSMSYQLLYL